MSDTSTSIPSSSLSTDPPVIRLTPFDTFVIDPAAYRFTLIDIKPKTAHESTEHVHREYIDRATGEVTRTPKWEIVVSAIEPDGTMNAVKVALTSDDTAQFASLSPGDSVTFENLRARFWSMADNGQRRSGYSVSCDSVRAVATERRTLTATAFLAGPPSSSRKRQSEPRATSPSVSSTESLIAPAESVPVAS
jgi:hypothetical protein